MPTAALERGKKLDSLSGKQKAAILLISLGPEKSARIFKHLKEDEIESLTLEISNIAAVMPDVKERVLDEFYQICLAQRYIEEGGLNYAKQVLEKALGPERARQVILKLTASLKTRPFDFVRKADPTQVLNFIRNEHPQIIALILSYLRPQQAAQVLAELEPRLQTNVARRIATMDRTSPEVVKEVERALEKRLSSLMTEDYTTVGGVDAVVEILSAVDRATEKNIMETLAGEDYDLSEEIKRKMFVFEDIITMDNRSIQTVLRSDIDNRELAVALKGASAEVRGVILANISKRLSAMIREDMEYMGPVRKSDVDEAQQKIVNIIRRLQDAGEIIVARGGGDEIIV
ncbi:MAG: flagellar motor switch protein FliG [Clostridiales bacterium]|jgi:flagellar motor switch protein FliG|nr:flagellar motor switch protein FliG [Clostridiales bacterium]